MPRPSRGGLPVKFNVCTSTFSRDAFRYANRKYDSCIDSSFTHHKGYIRHKVNSIGHIDHMLALMSWHGMLTLSLCDDWYWMPVLDLFR